MLFKRGGIPDAQGVPEIALCVNALSIVSSGRRSDPTPAQRFLKQKAGILDLKVTHCRPPEQE
jgi:hypothetical protein